MRKFTATVVVKIFVDETDSIENDRDTARDLLSDLVIDTPNASTEYDLETDSEIFEGICNK